MRVRRWAWLVLTGTVLGCSSVSSIELINDTNRPIYVRSRGESFQHARDWSGTIAAGERESIWVGLLPLESLAIEVDGKRFDYPPMAIPGHLSTDMSDQRDSWWRWTDDGPEFTAARLSHFQEMVRAYFFSLLAIIGFGVLCYKLARRDYIRRHS